MNPLRRRRRKNVAQTCNDFRTENDTDAGDDTPTRISATGEHGDRNTFAETTATSISEPITYLIGVVDNAENPYIPRVCGNFLHFLASEREADQFRVKLMIAMLQKRKRAIKIAAAHADTVSKNVKCDDRRENDIEPARRDRFATVWLQKSESIDQEIAFGGHFAELHVAIFFDDWRENALFHLPGARNYRPGIDLVPRRQITGDVHGTLKPMRTGGSFGDDLRCAFTYFGTQIRSRLATMGASFRLQCFAFRFC